MTPLTGAIVHNNLEVFKCLLEYGANEKNYVRKKKYEKQFEKLWFAFSYFNIRNECET